MLNDYNTYVMSRPERIKYICTAAVALFGIGLLFFNKPSIAAVMALGSFLYPKYKSGELLDRRKETLSLQFKEALQSLSSSLGAGKTLELAFKAALTDLRVIYPDEETLIVKELSWLCRRIELNEPVEAALADFAKRSGLEDIRYFTDVISVCKRTGGNLIHVVKNSSKIISDKIEIAQEIRLQLARQKFEQKILNLMPLVFIALVRYGGAGYMDIIYSSVKGYLLLITAAIILVVSYLISKKITDIRV